MHGETPCLLITKLAFTGFAVGGAASRRTCIHSETQLHARRDAVPPTCLLQKDDSGHLNIRRASQIHGIESPLNMLDFVAVGELLHMDDDGVILQTLRHAEHLHEVVGRL